MNNPLFAGSNVDLQIEFRPCTPANSQEIEEINRSKESVRILSSAASIKGVLSRGPEPSNVNTHSTSSHIRRDSSQPVQSTFWHGLVNLLTAAEVENEASSKIVFETGQLILLTDTVLSQPNAIEVSCTLPDLLPPTHSSELYKVTYELSIQFQVLDKQNRPQNAVVVLPLNIRTRLNLVETSLDKIPCSPLVIKPSAGEVKGVSIEKDLLDIIDRQLLNGSKILHRASTDPFSALHESNIFHLGKDGKTLAHARLVTSNVHVGSIVIGELEPLVPCQYVHMSLVSVAIYRAGTPQEQSRESVISTQAVALVGMKKTGISLAVPSWIYPSIIIDEYQLKYEIKFTLYLPTATNYERILLPNAEDKRHHDEQWLAKSSIGCELVKATISLGIAADETPVSVGLSQSWNFEY